MMEEDHELNCLSLGLVVAHSHSHSTFPQNPHFQPYEYKGRAGVLCPGCLWGACTIIWTILGERSQRDPN